MKKKWIIITGVLLVVVLGIVYFNTRTYQPTLQFQTAKVERGDITQQISVSGTLNPLQLVVVGTQVSGRVKKLYADFNQKVEKGQVLAEIDPSVLLSQLEQSKARLTIAQSRLSLAEKTYRRNEALVDKNYIARQDLDTALQELESARAQLAEAAAQVEQDEVNLSYATIYSPISGVVISREVDVGQTLAANFQAPTIFKIAKDLKQMQINAVVSEADIGNIKKDMPVTFQVDAYMDRKFTGTITQIRLNPNNQQNVVTYNVLVDVDNKDEVLLPGMTALVSITLFEKKNVQKIPNAALRFKPPGFPMPPAPDPSTHFIFISKGNSLTPIPIKTGVSDGRFTEIIGGAFPEETPVITGMTIPQ